MLPSYPKVYQLGHRYVDGILDGPHVVEEKVDGSQISFAVMDKQLHIRSKGAELFADNPEKMFKEGIEYIYSIKDLLRPGHIYRGEYLKSSKHNTLAYERIPRNHIMLFDIEDMWGNPINEIKQLEAARIGLECVPNIALKVESSKEILDLLNTPSCLGGQKIEGVVIKNYCKITPDKKYMVGKYVSEAFKERHDKAWKGANPSGKDIIQQIILSLKTDARYLKAVQHVRERGELTESPKDIGLLMKELHIDIEAEDADFIKDTLYKHHINNIKRGVCGGFAEWYKELLLEKVNGG